MIVTIDALFSTSNKIGAIIISTGSRHLVPSIKNTPSHVALLINDRWVHESTGALGVHVSSYPAWSKEHKEVAKIALASQEYDDIANLFRSIKAKKYDYLGAFYIAICIIPTFLGAKLPIHNAWESKNKYFCCEVLGSLTNHYYGMDTPVQILSKLERANYVRR